MTQQASGLKRSVAATRCASALSRAADSCTYRMLLYTSQPCTHTHRRSRVIPSRAAHVQQRSRVLAAVPHAKPHTQRASKRVTGSWREGCACLHGCTAAGWGSQCSRQPACCPGSCSCACRIKRHHKPPAPPPPHPATPSPQSAHLQPVRIAGEHILKQLLRLVKVAHVVVRLCRGTADPVAAGECLQDQAKRGTRR